MIEVSMTLLRKGARLPRYKTLGASGADIGLAADTILIPSHKIVSVPTGIQVDNITPGYEIQVRSRSSSFKRGLLIFPGTIDSDYRGEIIILVQNITNKDITLEPGQDIAQIVVAPVDQAEFTEKGPRTQTLRGRGGFGSTDGMRTLEYDPKSGKNIESFIYNKMIEIEDKYDKPLHRIECGHGIYQALTKHYANFREIQIPFDGNLWSPQGRVPIKVTNDLNKFEIVFKWAEG